MDFRDIIDRWPGGAPGFAADIGVSAGHARVMRNRDSVDSKYWLALVQAAKRHKLSGVTFAHLAKLAARGRDDGDSISA